MQRPARAAAAPPQKYRGIAKARLKPVRLEDGRLVRNGTATLLEFSKKAERLVMQALQLSEEEVHESSVEEE